MVCSFLDLDRLGQQAKANSMRFTKLQYWVLHLGPQLSHAVLQAWGNAAERLSSLKGPESVSQLLIGYEPAVCSGYQRKCGQQD